MSEPFAPLPPSGSLVSSTAISPVTTEVLDHAGREAARLIGTAAGRKAGRSGRKTQTAAPAVIADAPVPLPAPAAAATPRPEDDAMALALPEAPLAVVETAEPPIEIPEPFIETAVAEPDPTEVIEAPSIQAPIGQGDDPAPLVSDNPAPIEAVETTSAAPVAVTIGPEQAPDVLAAFGTLLADALQTNLEATVSFWTAMANVTSPVEILDLNATHLRRRLDSVLAQSRAFAALTRKLAVVSMTGGR